MTRTDIAALRMGGTMLARKFSFALSTLFVLSLVPALAETVIVPTVPESLDGANGGPGSNGGPGGAATAVAGPNNDSTNSLPLPGPGAANAISKSTGALGQTITASATSPVGGPASALTQTTMGGAVSLGAAINPGQSYSIVNAFLSGPPLTLAAGTMGAGYGGTGESLTYQESADFRFSGTGTILLGLFDPISIGNGFDSSTFEILVNGNVFLNRTFSDLASANSFFTDNFLDLGHFLSGVDVELLYSETMSSTQGFGFDYSLAATGFAGGVPEPSTWAMMLLGFAGLGFTFRQSRRKAAFG